MKSLVTGLPLDLRFCTKGELAIGILTGAYGDGLRFDFVCGDEVYGACTALRESWKTAGRPTSCVPPRTSPSRSPPGPR